MYSVLYDVDKCCVHSCSALWCMYFIPLEMHLGIETACVIHFESTEVELGGAEPPWVACAHFMIMLFWNTLRHTDSEPQDVLCKIETVISSVRQYKQER